MDLTRLRLRQGLGLEEELDLRLLDGDLAVETLADTRLFGAAEEAVAGAGAAREDRRGMGLFEKSAVWTDSTGGIGGLSYIYTGVAMGQGTAELRN